MNLIAIKIKFDEIAVIREKIQPMNPMWDSLPKPIIISNIVANKVIAEKMKKCLLTEVKLTNCPLDLETYADKI